MNFEYPKDFIKVNGEDFRTVIKDKLVRICRKQGMPVIVMYAPDDTILDLKTLPSHFFAFQRPYVIQTNFKL